MSTTSGAHCSKYAKDETWDEIYAEELASFSSNQDLTGSLEWYAEYQDRILEWLDSNWEFWSTVQRCDARVLDLGTGNGLFLARLFALGFTHLAGIDFCPQAISCARKLATSIREKSCMIDELDLKPSKLAEYHPKFSVDDIMGDTPCVENFDLIIDKGTLDVLYLQGRAAQMVKQVVTKYVKNQQNVVWVIATCNTTQGELKGLVEQNSEFKMKATPPDLPRMTYSGHVGHALSIGVFARQSNEPTKCE